MLRKFILIILLPVVIIGCSKQTKKHDYIEFQTNLDSARTMAVAEEEPLIIEFFKQGCPWSRMMDDSTFSDKIVIGMADDMLFCKIDADKDSAAAEQMKVSFYPTFIVCGPDGKEIDRMVGYYPPGDFFNEVQLFLQGNETLKDYKIRLADEPNRIEYHLILGEKYKYRSDWPKALEFYNNVVRLAQSDDDQRSIEIAKLGIADVYREMGEFPKAAYLYEEFLAQYPNSDKTEDAARKLPDCYAQMAQIDKAITLFHKYLDDYPNGAYSGWVKEKLEDLNRLEQAGK
jgi:tetratricopeptide (TPR) repeat protein